jgi:diguanylate cyclase
VNRQDRAENLAKGAIDLMALHRVAPTPENFELFYACGTGENPGLSHQIGALIAGNKAFTPPVLANLREQFFGRKESDRVAAEISAKISQTLEAVQKKLQAAGEDTVAFGKTLSAASGELTGDNAPETLRHLVEDLLAATQAMENRTQDLESELNRTSGEVTALRGKLEKVRRESLTDPLTGIPNRKAFDIALDTAVEEASATSEPLCVLMCDIDKFKDFNDTWGHQTGDQVLRLVGSCLFECVSGRDTAARYGGEEFAVVLPRTSLNDAGVLAEHIRTAVQARKLVKKTSGDILGTITISVGVAQFSPGESIATVVQRADACLYAAKRGGRNRVVSETKARSASAAA